MVPVLAPTCFPRAVSVFYASRCLSSGAGGRESAAGNSSWLTNGQLGGITHWLSGCHELIHPREEASHPRPPAAFNSADPSHLQTPEQHRPPASEQLKHDGTFLYDDRWQQDVHDHIVQRDMCTKMIKMICSNCFLS